MRSLSRKGLPAEVCETPDPPLHSSHAHRLVGVVIMVKDDGRRTNSVTGAQRVDGLAKVTGGSRYTADIRLPGLLIGRCLRSPYASARIISIDVSEARRLPGVHAVLTGADVPDTLFGRAVMDIP